MAFVGRCELTYATHLITIKIGVIFCSKKKIHEKIKYGAWKAKCEQITIRSYKISHFPFLCDLLSCLWHFESVSHTHRWSCGPRHTTPHRTQYNRNGLLRIHEVEMKQKAKWWRFDENWLRNKVGRFFENNFYSNMAMPGCLCRTNRSPEIMRMKERACFLSSIASSWTIFRLQWKLPN